MKCRDEVPLPVPQKCRFRKSAASASGDDEQYSGGVDGNGRS
jgi:hypothetical protein